DAARLPRQDGGRHPGGGGDAVHHRRGGALPLLHQQRLQPHRRDAPVGVPHGADQDVQQLREQGGVLQGRHARRRGLPRGADGGHQRPAPRPAVRLADQGPAEQRRGGGDRRRRGGRAPGPLPGGEPRGGQGGHEEGGHGRRGPRGGGQ